MHNLTAGNAKAESRREQHKKTVLFVRCHIKVSTEYEHDLGEDHGLQELGDGPLIEHKRVEALRYGRAR